MKITTDNRKLWLECLGLIKKKISDQAFQTWFDSLSLSGCTGEEITLQVPNRFHYEWLESKYSSIINEAIGQIFGKKLNINYSIVVKKEAPIEENIEKICKHK